MDYIEFWDAYDDLCRFVNIERMKSCEDCPIRERISNGIFEDAYHASTWANVREYVTDSLVCRMYVAMNPNSVDDILEIW